MPTRRAFIALAVVLAFSTACTGGGGEDPETTTPASQVLNAIVATSDHYVGDPQRVGVGLVLNDGRLVSYGSVDFRFSYVGDASGSTDPQPGPSATAVYLPTPGTDDSGTAPTITQPSQARGIYEAEDVTFDRAGFWQVDVAASIAGRGAVDASTVIPVGEAPTLPAPGQPALETRNLTLEDHDDAPLGAVDSRAVSEGEVPDAILHEMTIADALKQHMPAVIVFATPVFCESRFCGPVTDVIQDLAERYSDRAAFIHVEIYRDYETSTINQAAADWLLRNNDLTEPWIYLIGADGTIVDRWAVLVRPEELEAQLEALPPLER